MTEMEAPAAMPERSRPNVRRLMPEDEARRIGRFVRAGIRFGKERGIESVGAV